MAAATPALGTLLVWVSLLLGQLGPGGPMAGAVLQDEATVTFETRWGPQTLPSAGLGRASVAPMYLQTVAVFLTWLQDLN